MQPIMLDNSSQQALQITPIHFVSRMGLPIRTQGDDLLPGSIPKQFDGHAHMTRSRLFIPNLWRNHLLPLRRHTTTRRKLALSALDAVAI
jgi:hypothetical protein